MLKRLVSVVSFLLALASGCEPTVSEPLQAALPGASSVPVPGEEEANVSAPPAETDTSAILALSIVNNIRKYGCNCGEQPMPATGKVAWNKQLYEAALKHAKDMRAGNYFSHTSPSGENVYHRLIASGYITGAMDILSYGENIAFGDFDVHTAVQKWLASPSHCANMMRESYREMAIAHDGNYWVQVFGAKRK